jgi:hypothetical protein
MNVKPHALPAIIAMGVTSLLADTALAEHAGYPPPIQFDMVGSEGVAGCLPDASGSVTVKSQGTVEMMQVDVEGLPPKTEFDFFVIQLPNAPFGLSWYQGDLETNESGNASGTFIGRFNEETFIVAPGTGVAPQVHDADADTNPATDPVHTFHLGLWFNSPDDASKAGCSNTVTPFNGEHNAGIQVLNTSNFAPDKGPLLQLQP